jgi:DNA-binding NarL/FixJ family response regulator
VRVIVADDHRLVCAGAGALLAGDPRLEVVGLAFGGREAVRVALRTRPDVAVLDVRMPEVSGIQACAAIRDRLPTTRVLMLMAGEGEAELAAALRAGATACLPRHTRPRELIAAVLGAHTGTGTPPIAPGLAGPVPEVDAPGVLAQLSAREREILDLMTAGLRNREIAQRLMVTEATVKTHVRHVLRKLRLRNRAEAAAFAARAGRVDDVARSPG